MPIGPTYCIHTAQVCKLCTALFVGSKHSTPHENSERTSTVAMTTKTTRCRDRNLISHCLVFAILVTSLTQGTLGCFPVNDVFKTSCRWTQLHTVEGRYDVDLCQDSGDAGKGSRMTFTPQGQRADDLEEWHWDCVKVTKDDTHEHVSYLVKKSNSMKTLGYQCIKFFPLTQKVVRQELTPLMQSAEKADCTGAIYQVDENVLIASHDLDPVACPLAGGYQVLMHLSDSIDSDKKCLRSTATYRPHLQFQCDQVGSTRVLADLGPSCIPGILQESAPMKGRHLAHLDCVDSWQENSGTTEQSTAVLLRMHGSNQTFWCLSVRRVPNPSHTSVSSPEETLYTSFLTFDGRCVPNMRGQHSVPRYSTMFGHLAAFRPHEDIKCQDPPYLDGCKSEAEEKCQKSTDCPKICGRCLEKSPSPSCSINASLHGVWESFSSSGSEDTIIVSQYSVKTSKQGDFKCAGPAGQQDKTLALVQAGQHSTCVPYHSCAKLSILGPGLLSYQMFPANRNGDTGEVHSCHDTRTKNRQNRPEKTVETLTLVQPQKLQETPCGLATTMHLKMHNSGSGCRLTIHECSGTCHTFNSSLEAESCDNRTAEGAGLLSRHTCLAVLLDSDTRIMLTRSPETGQYLCWVMLSVNLFFLSPENCNTEMQQAAMITETVPNPLHMLKAVWPPEQTDDNDRNGAALRDAAPVRTASVLALLTLAISLL